VSASLTFGAGRAAVWHRLLTRGQAYTELAAQGVLRMHEPSTQELLLYGGTSDAYL